LGKDGKERGSYEADRNARQDEAWQYNGAPDRGFGKRETQEKPVNDITFVWPEQARGGT
jgi:hypothetical protein